MTSSDVLRDQYRRRFQAAQVYRDRVWQAILQGRLQEWVGQDQDVLDLGCGWGEFIRNVSASTRYALDLNPDAAERVGDGVNLIQQDCALPWSLEDQSLDVIFSSNFLEHLPDKSAVEATLKQAHRCLRTGGRLILLGPNMRYVGGAYWDFWDHHVAITDKSMLELLELSSFKAVRVIPRFLPYTMSEGRQVPVALVRLYLSLPMFWPLLGKQFLIIAEAQR